MMNILRKTIIAGVTVISLGAAAVSVQAQEAPRAHAYAATKFDPAQRTAAIAARQQKLKDALQLTAEQETAFETYLAAIKPQKPAAGTARVAFKDLNAPQRLAKSIELQKAHIAQEEKNLAALNTFYATLSPEQQKVFDLAGNRGRAQGFRRKG